MILQGTWQEIQNEMTGQAGDETEKQKKNDEKLRKKAEEISTSSYLGFGCRPKKCAEPSCNYFLSSSSKINHCILHAVKKIFAFDWNNLYGMAMRLHMPFDLSLIHI